MAVPEQLEACEAVAFARQGMRAVDTLGRAGAVLAQLQLLGQVVAPVRQEHELHVAHQLVHRLRLLGIPEGVAAIGAPDAPEEAAPAIGAAFGGVAGGGGVDAQQAGIAPGGVGRPLPR